MTDHLRVIAIDGPAAAGKSTVARILADRLGAMLFDTGVLYRVVAFMASRCGVSPHDARGLAQLAQDVQVSVLPPSKDDGRLYDVRIDNEDVTWAIRSPEVAAIVSRISEHAEVRSALLPVQRRIAAGNAVVMVGRDIGTVVVPDAGLKVYLDASPHERARRRFRESAARGSRQSFAEILVETMDRDAIDSHRSVAPLRPAPDALRIATDGVDAREVVAIIERIARKSRGPGGAPLWPE